MAVALRVGGGRRIKAAKIVLLAPEAYELLRENRVSLSTLELLSEVATKENVKSLLSLAEGKSSREVRLLVGAVNESGELPYKADELCSRTTQASPPE